MRQLLVYILVLFAGPLYAIPDNFTWGTAELQGACSSAFFANVPPGQLGLPVQGKLKPNFVYQRLDPRIGKVVYVLTDENGEIDLRPLGRNSILECRQVGIEVEDGFSPWCQLKDGNFRGLKRSSRLAKNTVLYQLSEILRPDYREKKFFHWLEWTRTEERPFLRRNPESVVNTTPRKLANTKAYRPGETVPKFYRKENEYWQNLYGVNYPVPSGQWMQLFSDGNYYLVDKGFHLEHWPTEKNILVKVPDNESWIKIGRGENAYLFVESQTRKQDWVHYYTEEGYLPSNPEVNAVDACKACPKRPRLF
ncbi:MAG: hypothetical protein H6617_02675 [Bdellovibrionaceae bacterium]|nr:hypothetical protein [Bdellovibrionales bacterium]MCB9253567.1 hypothetical protein [Pseudobdellovibrionaceae bacterium]